jgi:hypothetical protein
MSAAATKIRDGIGKVFDVLRSGVFLDSADTLTLIKASSSANTFSEVFEFTGKWWIEYDEHRKTPKFIIADNSDEVTEAFEEGTHFKVNDDVYVIDRGATLPPLGASMMWTVYAQREAKRGQFQELW